MFTSKIRPWKRVNNKKMNPGQPMCWLFYPICFYSKKIEMFKGQLLNGLLINQQLMYSLVKFLLALKLNIYNSIAL
jgi:hypothetical protein